jgi:hypothetical protein
MEIFVMTSMRIHVHVYTSAPHCESLSRLDCSLGSNFAAEGSGYGTSLRILDLKIVSAVRIVVRIGRFYPL